MIVNQLVIEVTRRCNATCEHCLRGEPQNIDIRPEYIDALAANISEIGLLTISGGEPSLALPQTRRLLESFMKRDILITEQLYVATNGIENTAELIEILKPWSDKTKVTLALSNTAMHPEAKEETIHRVEKSGFGVVGSRDENLRDYGIILEGRALVNHGQIKHPRSAYREGSEITVKGNEVQGVVYINTLGFVIEGATYSYETQDSGAVTKGHVFDFFQKGKNNVYQK
jgi:hypothetical protein